MKRTIILAIIAIFICGLSFANEGDNATFEFRYNDPLTSQLAGTDGAQRVEYMTIMDDCDGDGTPEIICAPRLGGSGSQGARLEVYEATGDNTYAMIWSWDGDSATFWRSNVITCADLDGNGTKEIIMGVNSNVTDVLAVFECTGDNTWDDTPNLYTWADLGGDGSITPDFASTIIAGNLDSDSDDEVALCTTNPDDAIIIASVASGTFADDNIVWTKEFERIWETTDKGSPYGMDFGDIDGDGNMDIIVVCWDNLRCDIYESSAANTYALASSNNLAAGDDYSWYAAKIADVDADGIGEVWILDINTGFVLAAEISDVSTVTDTDFVTVFDLDYFGGAGNGQINMAFGDQDHGTGSDGIDLYLVGAADGVVYDLEFKSGDPLDNTNWTKNTIATGTDTLDTLWMVEAPAVDLDGDTNSEIVFTRQDADGTRAGGIGTATDEPSLYIYEWNNVIVLNAHSVWNLYE